MSLLRPLPSIPSSTSSCFNYRVTAFSSRLYSESFGSKYSEEQRSKILKVINESDNDLLSRYDITKARLKHISQWKTNNGAMKTLADVKLVQGFTGKLAQKLFDSILEEPEKNGGALNKIKGQVLYPALNSTTIKECKLVLTVYISVNSVCWTLIDKTNYEVLEWKYYGINYPEGKKFQITNILDIAWSVTNSLPVADIYVMKAEATTLRAAGSDPNNPKVIAVNLQKAQMVSMIVALINSRDHIIRSTEEGSENTLKHKVYFLRPSLPYRLYGTLVGNEHVSTDQTVEMLLQSDQHFRISESLKTMFRKHKELEQDMLGQCLLLSLTFMDLCIYKDEKRIAKLLKKD